MYRFILSTLILTASVVQASDCECRYTRLNNNWATAQLVKFINGVTPVTYFEKTFTPKNTDAQIVEICMSANVDLVESHICDGILARPCPHGLASCE